MQASINQPTVPSPSISYNRGTETNDTRRKYWYDKSDPTSARHYIWKSPPYENGKAVGAPGYKWIYNMAANDGDYYAVYQPVRGGDNRRYYNLVKRLWENSKYESAVWCDGCRGSFTEIRPGINHCPNCGKEKASQF